MDCANARGLLSPFMDGDLEGHRKNALEGHLGSCSSCREELAGLRQSLAKVEGLPQVSLPPEFAAQVMGLVLSRAEVSRSRRARAAWVLATVSGGLLGILILLVSPDVQAWQMDVESLGGLFGQPDWLDQLAYLLTSIEVGMMVGISLLFLALASSLVQLMGREASPQNGHAYHG